MQRVWQGGTNVHYYATHWSKSHVRTLRSMQSLWENSEHAACFGWACSQVSQTICNPGSINANFILNLKFIDRATNLDLPQIKGEHASQCAQGFTTCPLQIWLWQFTQTTNQSQVDIFHKTQSQFFFITKPDNHNQRVTLNSRQEHELVKIPWLESKSLSVSFFLTLQTAFQLSQEHIASSRNLPHTCLLGNKWFLSIIKHKRTSDIPASEE